MKTMLLAAAAVLSAGSVFAENLFPWDTGVETGIRSATLGGLGRGLVPAFRDTKVFYEGKSSLRIDWNGPVRVGNKVDTINHYIGMESGELERGKEYTVSFYAKASVDDFPVGVHLFTVGGWRRDTSYYLRATLTREWKRYSFTFRVKTPRDFPTNAYSLNLMMPSKGPDAEKSSVWLDAFQLEKGTRATPYAPPRAAAVEVELKSDKLMHILHRNDRIEAKVRTAILRECGNPQLKVTVRDWEGKVRKEYSEPLKKRNDHSFLLPSDRFGWFNVSAAVVSGSGNICEDDMNYVVVRPPVETAPGLRPYSGVDIPAASGSDWNMVRANREIGAGRIQTSLAPFRGWVPEPVKGKLDFTYCDLMVKHALKNNLKVKMIFKPFDKPNWHFTKQEVAAMKKAGTHHNMFDLRHRKLWNSYVKQILDRYGDKLDTIEFGGEDNGRLGINPYFKQKYPEGVQKDKRGVAWVVAGPAFDALCTLVTDACRMARKRYPNLRVGAIRPSQGRPGDEWFFVWKMFEKIGREFNTFPVDTYSMVPYYVGPRIDKSKRHGGGPEGRFATMAHAKRMIEKFGCGQDVYLSETGTCITPPGLPSLSPYRREGAVYLAQDMICARCAGFTAYDVFQGVLDTSQDGWAFNNVKGMVMRAAAYSQLAQILENVTESRWIKPDKATCVALFKKHDGSGVGAVWAQTGFSIRIPEGIQISDFMGNEIQPGKGRMLDLSDAPHYLRASSFQLLEKLMRDPVVEQGSFCTMAFRHKDASTGLIRISNNSFRHALELDCVIQPDAGGRKFSRIICIAPGSWSSVRVPVDRSTRKVTVKYRKCEKAAREYSVTLDVPVLTPVASGETPSSVMGVVETGSNIVPFEPWTPWSGIKDLGVTLYGSWTGTELKLKAVVTDDLHYPSKDVHSPWSGDCLQIAIDPKNNAPFFIRQPGMVLDTDDVEIAFMLRGAQVSNVISAGRKDLKMNVKAVRDDRAGTTVYEIGIPWRELGVKPFKGMVFGLSAVVFDDDSGKGQEYKGLIGGGIVQFKDPRAYKRFTLK